MLTPSSQSNTLLISIPNAALLNLRTLKPLYPPSFADKLNAIQWLSLHIALELRRHLSPSESTSTTPSKKDYWPFLASLPRSFPTVPLTWAIASRTVDTLRAEYAAGDRDASLNERVEKAKLAGVAEKERRKRRRYADLCDVLPPSVRRRTEDIEKRFKADWLVVKEVWVRLPDSTHLSRIPPDLSSCRRKRKTSTGTWRSKSSCSAGSTVRSPLLPTLSRAFLILLLPVNTRCIYFDIDGKKENNLTLCPVVDMINHVAGRTTKPSPRINSLTFSSPSAASADPILKDGDELSFSYGPHQDAMLLTEYGFVIGRDNVYQDVEVDRFVEGLFDAQGREGEIKKGVLLDEGYWGCVLPSQLLLHPSLHLPSLDRVSRSSATVT